MNELDRYFVLALRLDRDIVTARYQSLDEIKDGLRQELEGAFEDGPLEDWYERVTVEAS